MVTGIRITRDLRPRKGCGLANIYHKIAPTRATQQNQSGPAGGIQTRRSSSARNTSARELNKRNRQPPFNDQHRGVKRVLGKDDSRKPLEFPNRKNLWTVS